MSPSAARAEHGVGDRMAQRVRVGVARQSRRVRDRHAAEDRAAAPAPGDASRSRCRSARACGAAPRRRPGQRRARKLQILGRRDLDVARIARRRAGPRDPPVRRARPRRCRCHPRAPSARARGEHLARERLRRLRQPDASRGMVAATRASFASSRASFTVSREGSAAMAAPARSPRRSCDRSSPRPRTAGRRRG